MHKFDLNYLKCFYYVVTLNGFTKAAQALHVQQPVISRAVKLLENELGFKLLERQKKQVILTPEGKEVLKMAQEIFLNADRISIFAKERLGKISGDFCFATSDSLSPLIMGSILKKISDAYPQIRPIHHAGPATMLLDKIRDGKIELGVFFNVPDIPQDLEIEKLGKASFEFVVAKKFEKEKEVLESFIASKELDEGRPDRLPLFQKYKGRQKNVSITSISTSSMARKTMVLNGMGVTILPRFLVQDELEKGSLVSLQEGSYLLPLYVVARRSSYKSKLKDELLNLIKTEVI